MYVINNLVKTRTVRLLSFLKIKNKEVKINSEDKLKPQNRLSIQTNVVGHRGKFHIINRQFRHILN